MNSSNQQSTRVHLNAKLSAMLVAAILSFGSVLPLPAQQPAGVASPSSSPHGQTYPQWAGAWWKWFMELPLTNSAGDVHPGSACAPHAFDVTEGQTGNVWFLAAPFSTPQVPSCTRTATIPLGTSLFFQLLGAEWSNLEGPGPVCANVSDTSCQQANATFFANDITDLVAEIDGKRVHLLSAFRFVNPQISFFAPCPCWIFKCVPNSKPGQPPRAACGPGTSTGDGYFIFLDASGLGTGQHTIHYEGAFPDFGASLDMTYIITVE